MRVIYTWNDGSQVITNQSTEFYDDEYPVQYGLFDASDRGAFGYGLVESACQEDFHLVSSMSVWLYEGLSRGVRGAVPELRMVEVLPA